MVAVTASLFNRFLPKLGVVMLKLFASACVVSIALSGAAYAANCPNHPYNLTNGTSADANQVMADFNNLLNCANTSLPPLADPHFTGILDVTGSSQVQGTNPRVVLRSSDANTADRITDIYGTSSSATWRFYKQVRGSDPTLVYMNILSNGSVGIGTDTPSLLFQVNGTAGGTSAYQVVSDARLKKNVQPISGGLSLITRLNPISYDWRSTDERGVGKSLNLAVGEKQLGFIAQEVEKVVPEAVSKPKGSDGVYSLKQENLIPLLVAAIKEQQAEIEQLRAKLNALSPASPN